MPGYAIVDVKTTGPHAESIGRMVEIAIVRIDGVGRGQDSWTTIINPGCELNAESVHGLEASLVRTAPRIRDIAAAVIARLAGRVLVAHDAERCAASLTGAFARAGIGLPDLDRLFVSTMELGREFLATNRPSLARCCEAAGVTYPLRHAAMDDATTVLRLFRKFLLLCAASRRGGEGDWRDALPWQEQRRAAGATSWPTIQRLPSLPMPRPDAPACVTCLLDSLPSSPLARPVPGGWRNYISLLQDALIDRRLNAAERDRLVEAAAALGLGADDARKLHELYLAGVARLMLIDGALSRASYANLRTLAQLLGLPESAVGAALASAQEQPPGQPALAMAGPVPLWLSTSGPVLESL